MFDIKYQTISLTRGDSATLTVYTGNKSTSSYGFPPDTELQYIVIYSS